MGPDSRMSRPLPCGTPSTTSTRTTSASSLSAMRTAQLAPTLPAPMTVTFFLICVIWSETRLYRWIGTQTSGPWRTFGPVLFHFIEYVRQDAFLPEPDTRDGLTCTKRSHEG